MRSFSLGLVSVLKSLLPMDVDVFLSGHADGLDKKAIEALITQIEQKQAKVKALVQEGKTLAEVKRAMAGADQPAAAKDADDACRQVVSFAKLRRNRPSNKP